ncbi:D-amino-acid oxidase [Lentinula aff. lateritia]|uniref:D-amino-acid oxidase n=1 Tax=Lentinula aff. lateritia TaxID=2804960 RepID=A0ACC1UBW6_9AGAR|nr:D-amino-acid oxidase [Lentinula aff. lateritia]
MNVLPTSENKSNTKHVLVLGAGVVGLTTAITILESNSKKDDSNYSVTILAAQLPTDPKSIAYTSHWAGAHHVSHSTGTGVSAPDANSSTATTEHPEQLAIDQETFRVMWDLSSEENDAEKCFMRIEQVEYYFEEIPIDENTGEGRHHLGWYPNFKILSPSTLESSPLSLADLSVHSGVSFNTLTIDPPVYLRYLYDRFIQKGGKVLKGRVDNIKDIKSVQRVLREAIEAQQTSDFGKSTLNPDTPPPIDALINCTGLGSLTLHGVQDEAMYPLRGQTVLMKTPWVNFGRTLSRKGKDGGEDLWTYIIPRRSGDVIIGGIKSPNDFFPTPRPETTLDIMRRGVRLCPELLHPPQPTASTDSAYTPTTTLTPDALDNLSDTDFLNLVEPFIIEAGCGLRPARKGGLRLEVEWIVQSSTEPAPAPQIPLVHNYGHAGSGFQSSWGSATRAMSLLEGALQD